MLRTTYARDFAEIVVNNHECERSTFTPSRFDLGRGQARYGVVQKWRAPFAIGHMGLRGPGPGNDCRFGHSGSPASKGFARQTGLRGASWGQVTSGFGRCGLSRLFRGVSPVSRNADLLRPARRIGRVSRHPNLRVVGPKSARVRRCEFQEGVEDRRGIHACLTRHNAGRARR